MCFLLFLHLAIPYCRARVLMKGEPQSLPRRWFLLVSLVVFSGLRKLNGAQIIGRILAVQQMRVSLGFVEFVFAPASLQVSSKV